MVFMVLSTIYVLVFPTLAGSMTGYISVMKAFVKDRSGSIIPFENFNYVAYIIHDGQRVNLTADYIIPYADTANAKSKQDPMASSPSPDCPDPGDKICSLKNAASHYVSNYGFYGLDDVNTTWEIDGVYLEPPALNISAFYLTYYTPPSNNLSDNRLFGNGWVDPRTGQRPFNDSARLTWTANGQLFSIDDIKANGACQPMMNAYEWGFSFVQAILNAIIMTAWTIGLWLLWLAAQYKLPLQREQEVAKGWRAVSYLAETMRRQFDEAGINPQSLREKPLKQEINKYLNGGDISFIAESPEKSQLSLGHGLLLWFKQNKWWCLVFFLLLLGTGLSQRPVLYPLFATVYGMLMAMALVDGVASRILVILPFMIVSLFGLLFALLYVT
ncbi:hypothetical protein PG994_005048 [Apiospora phragmitis]|uniref:Uncharacterized protein n=1 Tax=Apiospora phragmitis TaxID=2905665 RepID=A0ABR1VW65_9PEZI